MRHWSTAWYFYAALIFVGCLLSALSIKFGLFDLEQYEQIYGLLNGVLNTHWGLAYLLLFVVDVVAVSLLIVPPSVPLTLLAGLLFGPFFGALLCVLAKATGGLCSYIFWRRALERVGGVEGNVLGRYASLFEAIEGRTTALTLFAFRLAPLPFGIVTIGAALANFRLRTFALVTLVGQIPASIFYAQMGAGIGKHFGNGARPSLATLSSDDSFRWPVLGLLALALIGFALDQVLRNQNKLQKL